MTLAPPAVTTALYLVIFGTLIGQRVGSMGGFSYKQYIAPGLIVMPVVAGSYSHAALSLLTAKLHKLLDEHLVSPQPSWMIVVSYAAGASLRGILVGLVVAVIVLIFIPTYVHHLPYMAAAMLLISLVAALAGFINGVFVKTFDQASWIPSFILTPLTYFGGVFYSLSLLPTWAQHLVLANPIFYMVDLFRYCMLGVSDVRAGVAVSVMLLMALAMFATAAVLMRRGIGIKE
jgi:ABC-2 type transport system permease protein